MRMTNLDRLMYLVKNTSHDIDRQNMFGILNTVKHDCRNTWECKFILEDDLGWTMYDVDDVKTHPKRNGDNEFDNAFFVITIEPPKPGIMSYSVHILFHGDGEKYFIGKDFDKHIVAYKRIPFLTNEKDRENMRILLEAKRDQLMGED